jgi:hypothetical protein
MKRIIATAPTNQMMLFMRPPMSQLCKVVLEISLPSTIWLVRVSLAYGEVFPDAAPRTSVWLPHDDEFSLEKDCRHLSARS